jgi:hypothetical protein
VRDVLVPVYEALNLPWDPATVGSLDDEVAGITWEATEAAILKRLRRTYTLLESELPGGVLELAETLQAAHAA